MTNEQFDALVEMIKERIYSESHYLQHGNYSPSKESDASIAEDIARNALVNEVQS